MRQNYLVLKGLIGIEDRGQQYYFPIKIVVPQGFPYNPPKVFLDMALKRNILDSKQYLGALNAIIIPYLLSWTQNHNA